MEQKSFRGYVIATTERHYLKIIQAPAETKPEEIQTLLEDTATRDHETRRNPIHNDPVLVDLLVIPDDSEVLSLLTPEREELLPIIHRCWQWLLKPHNHPDDRRMYLLKITKAMTGHMEEEERNNLYRVLSKVFQVLLDDLIDY